MTGREETLQALDPLGALAGRPLTVLGALAATGVAIVLTAVHGREVGNVPLGVLAVACCVAACLVLLRATDPRRAPVRRRSAVTVVALGVVANAVAALSAWGQNSLVRDDWGPVVLGLLLLSLCPYRPPAEIRTLTVLAGLGVAVITVIESPFFVTQLPPIIFVAIAVVPVVALGFGGAAFSTSVLSRLERWRARAEKASRLHVEQQEEGIVRSVQQGRVSILNRDVVPLFADLVAGGEVTAEHARRATEVSSAIRALMVAETERSWLDDLLVPTASASGSAVWASPVSDPDHVADAMDFDQRSAIRALITALVDRAAVRDLALALRRSGHEVSVLLRCSTELDSPSLSTRLAPYVAVLRAVFDNLVVEPVPPQLTMRFTYVTD
ncbi:hypothetical protein [Naasia aerilata]|uniref:Uncharacterized protein n=1 Tax=Naasia aerilata TaxID=1162966 RepID=A0ABM8GBY5_9MICO|nr:hypothetical protein [Naasia aerilata]BDZ45750.1 hypothetical protein GCM10025866_16590 [Naasia aerilata]